MFELLLKGGWLMLPLLLSSVLAFAIIIERFWELRRSRVVPANMVQQI